MKSELEFLNKLKSELSDVEYGEGVVFNLREIKLMIKNRINELSKLHQPTVSNSSLICERCQGAKVVLIGSQDTRPCPDCC